MHDKDLKPTGDDDWFSEEAARFMRPYVQTIMVLGALVQVWMIVSNGWRWDSFSPSLLVGVAAVSALLMRRGELRLAICWFLGAAWVVLTLWACLLLGVRTPGIALYLILIMLAGWLLGRVPGLLMALISIVALAVIYAAERYGWLVFTLTRGPDAYFVTIGAYCVVVALIAGSIGDGFRRYVRSQRTLTERLRDRVQALEQSEAHARFLFQSNPLPCMLTRLADGALYEVNDAWVRELGWSREEIAGKTVVDLGYWDSPEQRQQAHASLIQERHLAARIHTMPNKHGVRRTYLIYGEIIEIEGEQRFFSVMIDQTERLQAEDSVRTLNATLEARVVERTQELTRTIDTLKETQLELVHAEKLASLGSLVAGISHDLNTPIGNTLTVASTLEERVREFEQAFAAGNLRKSALQEFLSSAQEMSGLLVRSCQRATDLIASFKQVAVDQTSERRREFDLAELTNDLLATLKPTYKHVPWEMRVDIPASIVCDSYPGPLGQVLTNLVQNAFIHAFEGCMQGCIQVSARLDEGGWVEIAVRDNGKGMDSATLSHIFDPFFTTRLGRGGSGIGLSVSHRIVTSVLAGEMRVESRPGEGSCFSVRFPRSAPQKL